MGGVKKETPANNKKTNFRRDFSIENQLTLKRFSFHDVMSFCCCVGKVNTFLSTMQVFSYLFAENFHIFAVPVAKICCST